MNTGSICLFIGSLVPALLMAQKSPQAADNSMESFAMIETMNTNCRMFYDSTKISKSDAIVVVELLEKKGIWSSRVRDAKAFFEIDDHNVYSIHLIVAQRALSSPAVDSIALSMLHEFKSYYSERTYNFQLMAVDSNLYPIKKILKLY